MKLEMKLKNNLVIAGILFIIFIGTRNETKKII